VARPASLWLQSPLSRRNWIRVTGARITATKAANLPPQPTGRLSLPDPLEVGRGGLFLRQSLLVEGKFMCWGWMSAVALCRLIHIVDGSHRSFLVDTGAAYSIFPFSSSGRQSSPRLMGGDGLHIPCWGERRLSLVFHGHRFEWPFLLAMVQFPIISLDFLRHFKLMVYSAASHLVDTVSTHLLPTVSRMCSHPELAATMAKAASVSSRLSCPNAGGGSEASPCIPDWLQPKRPAHLGCDHRHR
jgi:hypothetical protein